MSGTPMSETPVPVLALVRLPHGEGLALPAFETAGAAGMDLSAALAPGEKLIIAPGARVLLPTGFVFQIPQGFEGQVRPRSGLAFKHGITCLNTPGTIDSDYRGEVKVLLINLGTEAFSVTRGMRIAQMLIAPVTRATIVEVPAFDTTERGSGGFGSTGV